LKGTVRCFPILTVAVRKSGHNASPVVAMYDRLCSPHQGYFTENPVSATYYCRRLVLASTASEIYSSLDATYRLTLTASSNAKTLADLDFENFPAEAWSTEFKGPFFTDLGELREDLELVGFRLKQNMITVRILSRLDTERRDYRYYTLKDSGYRGEIDDHLSWWDENVTAVTVQVDHDLDQWDSLKDMENYTYDLMKRTTDSYVQTVQATSARLANKQAGK
jgi:type II secretory pathway component PulJ